MGAPQLLSLTGVCKSHGGQRVLGPIDLSFAAGERTALIGPSGCGKTTLLRLLLGLLVPETGEVRFRGQPLRSDDLEKVRPRIGYVVQDGGLFPHLTAAGNITLMARYLGWDEARIAGRLDQLLQLARLPADLLARYPAQLSGGQRQRVSLLRALMLDPEVLLLDEPLGALDPMVRTELQEDLAGIFRSLGKTVVLVTHDLAEAGFLAEQIVLLQAGQVVQRGSLADLTLRPATPFVSAFVNAQRGHALRGLPA